MLKQYPAIGITDDTLTPVVAECDDSYLNDSQGRHVTEQDVVLALEGARSGTVRSRLRILSQGSGRYIQPVERLGRFAVQTARREYENKTEF